MRYSDPLEHGAPSARALWPGAILGTVAHALFVSRAPVMAHEQSWDGWNYSVNNTEGSRGTVAFGRDFRSFVAVVYDHESPRSPWKGSAESGRKLVWGLERVPSMLNDLAREALEYVLQERGGAIQPIVTAAFWGSDLHVNAESSEPWKDVFQHGGRLMHIQLRRFEDALALWAEHYELSDHQIRMADSIARRRIDATGPIALTATESKQLINMALDEEGLAACRSALRSVGIGYSAPTTA